MVAQRDVWDLIVNNDDICFQHILPKLNATDAYGVNTETKIKRSSRANLVDIDFGSRVGE